MQVTPNGNGFDVTCPDCHQSSRAYVAVDGLPPNESVVRGDGTIDFVCKAVIGEETVIVNRPDPEHPDLMIEVSEKQPVRCTLVVAGGKLVSNV